MYEIYWSKSQMRARTHPNMHAVMKALLGLWHSLPEEDAESAKIAEESGLNLTQPLMYVDRLRMRPPGDSQVRDNVVPWAFPGFVNYCSCSCLPLLPELFCNMIFATWERQCSRDP